MILLRSTSVPVEISPKTDLGCALPEFSSDRLCDSSGAKFQILELQVLSVRLKKDKLA